MSDQRKIDALAKLVKANNEAYWKHHAPIISDEAYDSLVEELRALDPAHPILKGFGERAPTTNGIKHAVPMLSLAKCYDEKALKRWASTVKGNFIVQPKYDGISIELEYDEFGALLTASTRGDGLVGEDVTECVQYVGGVPLKINTIDTPCTIRGELYMPRSVFAASYSTMFANTRNVVAGAIGRKTPEVGLLRDLRFVAYDVQIENNEFAFDSEALFHIQRYGWDIAECSVVSTVSEAVTMAGVLRDARAKIDCDLDGVVIKANLLSTRTAMGVTGHHPRWAMAWKFQGDSGTTVLRDVKWQVSRTGTITPVAVFDPVVLSGASVTEATLHHLTRMVNMDLFVGDTIEVTRRGGVIPHVERMIRHAEGNVTECMVPIACPSCNSSVRVRSDFLECTQPKSCPAVQAGKLEHWCKVTGMLGFGPSVCAELYEDGINTPFDLYTADGLDILAGAVGEKTARTLIAEIDKTRTLPLATFLQALSIDCLGSTVSEKLAQRYTLEQLLSTVDVEHLSEINGIGSRIAEAVVCGIEDNESLIAKLLFVITIAPQATASTDGALSGKVFVFTGEVEGMTREMAQAQVRALGGTCPSSVTKSTTNLVIGDGAGITKRSRAEVLNEKGAHISIMTADEFVVLLNSVLPPIELL